MISLTDVYNSSWRRFLLYRSQSIHLPCRSMYWFLYDRDLRHKKVKSTVLIGKHLFAKIPLTRTTSTSKSKPEVYMKEKRKKMWRLFKLYNKYHCTKIKFSIKDFFSKCDQIPSFLRIWLHLPKKSLMENFIFCAVYPGKTWMTSLSCLNKFCSNFSIILLTRTTF